MKAKDVKPLCTWEERTPVLKDRFFYVPGYYQDHVKHSRVSFEEVFGNNHPVAVEYCSGNGSWIIQKALAEPQRNWVAVEKRFDRVRKIYAKGVNAGLKNLLVVWAEGCTFTTHYVTDACVDEIFINFPDPWPKRQAAKHRLLTEEFIAQMARVLGGSGRVVFVTDDPTYRDQTAHLFFTSSDFKSQTQSGLYVTEWEGYGTSFFDTLWRGKGREIFYQKWGKVT